MQVAADSNLAEIVAISDPSKECLAEASRIVPQSRSASFDELINDDDIDGIIIATPSALHMQQAVAAFEKGKAVFCQKPLGRNHNEVAAVVEAAKRNDKLLGADFSYRYTE